MPLGKCSNSQKKSAFGGFPLYSPKENIQNTSLPPPAVSLCVSLRKNIMVFENFPPPAVSPLCSPTAKKGFKDLSIKTALGLTIGMRPAVSAGVPFSKLKTRFSSDWDSGIQNPPTGPSRTDMRFFIMLRMYFRAFPRSSPLTASSAGSVQIRPDPTQTSSSWEVGLGK